ncbi:M20/M25/M40 family metallo-hydrolase [Candidatus Chloroploca asiatica]|uniref:Peptidase M20 n=1 Tax=Candidatus Chloroploca asiatica TaxID=1506545 RepID=A0A2H3KK34_9CHLR|nr:M20/M25/M40 family metallo-hydrolase [Candidatus Chloroploca asiatica]PDV97538.1 peptidase M20 [Candidatus Chloroploca asiatica]
MSALPFLLTDKLIHTLSVLCAQPSSIGQEDDLRTSAELLATMMRGLGMQVHVANGHPPVVIGRRAGRNPASLLLYHRFDAAPPGPWRAWSHNPYQLAERDGALYGRGVAEGKGPLAAHMQAIQALLATYGELPCGLVIVADGGGLLGSPTLAAALDACPDLIGADACLGSIGDRNAAGIPLCYSGSKGFLQMSLSARGPTHPLPPGAAPSLSNPLWRLTWALASIKGADEDIRIPGFYDDVEGPSREENAALRQLRLDEAGRLAAWGADEFLFGMRGVALVRAEITLPTCNLSSMHCQPEHNLALLPSVATAVLDFQLVPRQDPAVVSRLLRTCLDEGGFGDVTAERLPGGYAPAHTPHDNRFIRQVAAAGATVFDALLPTVPAGAFTLPLQLFVERLHCPVASVGLAYPDNLPFGPDEHVALDDLMRHGHLLIELVLAVAGEE